MHETLIRSRTNYDMAIRVLVVDDEQLARRRIRSLLSSHPEFEVVGECANGCSAIDAITKTKPDVLFLDVQLPDIDGFSVLRDIARDSLPKIVFVTAYDQYAVEAFRTRAIDYLLKPFSRERFSECIARIKEQNGGAGESDRRVLDLLAELRPPKLPSRIVVRTNGKALLIPVQRIDWVQAERDYVRVHVGKDSYLLRGTISSFESRLDPANFVRVHRSAIVNLDSIAELQTLGGGDFSAVLRTGTEIPLSRGCRERVRRALPDLF